MKASLPWLEKGKTVPTWCMHDGSIRKNSVMKSRKDPPTGLHRMMTPQRKRVNAQTVYKAEISPLQEMNTPQTN